MPHQATWADTKKKNNHVIKMELDARISRLMSVIDQQSRSVSALLTRPSTEWLLSILAKSAVQVIFATPKMIGTRLSQLYQTARHPV